MAIATTPDTIFHHHFAHSRMPGASHNGGDEIIGEHRGFAAIVVDGNSGRTLYARNEHELRHPASVTKVMTLYLLFEQLEKGRLRLDTPLDDFLPCRRPGAVEARPAARRDDQRRKRHQGGRHEIRQ